MQRILLMLCIIFALVTGLLLILHYASPAVLRSGCVDTAATPDYLSSNSPRDAIAAINNARQLERLHPLRLPANFYQLDPVQQQFLLLNFERTDRGLHALHMDENLSQMALGYSKQLRNLNFFSHTSPIGGTFTERMNSNPAVANHYSVTAENLAGNPVAGIGPMYEYMYNDSVEACGHRHNLLDPALTVVGINWVPGSIYGSISVQEFLAPASWNPYLGATPDMRLPQLTIQASKSKHNSFLYCQALTGNNTSIVRITWFLDSISKPSHIGQFWTLDLHRLSPGQHTLFAYAVDGEQNYGVARYVIVA